MDVTSETRAHNNGTSGRTLFTLFAGMVLTIAGVTAFVVVAAGGGKEPADAAGRGQVAPLELASVSDRIAGHYRYAKVHTAEYEQIPCWCGCEQFLDHRNLADCFVRADGKGWEAHAAGCGVCNAEAVIAERMLAEGHSPLDVKSTVDSQFGTTAITAPPTA